MILLCKRSQYYKSSDLVTVSKNTPKDSLTTELNVSDMNMSATTVPVLFEQNLEKNVSGIACATKREGNWTSLSVQDLERQTLKRQSSSSLNSFKLDFPIFWSQKIP